MEFQAELKGGRESRCAQIISIPFPAGNKQHPHLLLLFQRPASNPDLTSPLCIPCLWSCSSKLVFCSFSDFIWKLFPVFPPQCCPRCWCLGTQRFQQNSHPWMITATPSQRTLTSLQVSSPRATTFQVPCVFHPGRGQRAQGILPGDPKLRISLSILPLELQSAGIAGNCECGNSTELCSVGFKHTFSFSATTSVNCEI